MLKDCYNLVVKCDEKFDKSNVVYELIDDEKNLLNKEIDIPFYDKRINIIF